MSSVSLQNNFFKLKTFYSLRWKSWKQFLRSFKHNGTLHFMRIQRDFPPHDFLYASSYLHRRRELKTSTFLLSFQHVKAMVDSLLTRSVDEPLSTSSNGSLSRNPRGNRFRCTVAVTKILSARRAFTTPRTVKNLSRESMQPFSTFSHSDRTAACPSGISSNCLENVRLPQYGTKLRLVPNGASKQNNFSPTGWCLVLITILFGIPPVNGMICSSIQTLSGGTGTEGIADRTDSIIRRTFQSGSIFCCSIGMSEFQMPKFALILKRFPCLCSFLFPHLLLGLRSSVSKMEADKCS